MSRYLLIQSKSPWESGDVGRFYALARELRRTGSEVTFFLVQNGVMAARTGAQDPAFEQLAGDVRVIADEFSLRERAIRPETLKSGVTPSAIDEVVDLLAGGAKAIWH